MMMMVLMRFSDSTLCFCLHCQNCDCFFSSGAHPDRRSRRSWAPCHHQRQSPLVECSLAQTFPEMTCSPEKSRAVSEIGEAAATGTDMVVEIPFTRCLAKQRFLLCLLCFGMSESTCVFTFRMLCSASLFPEFL